MSEYNPYLFPAPGVELRDLLNCKAHQGIEFRDDQAALDVMLDLDLVQSGHLKKLHAYSYYANRWSWSKARVARAFSGRVDRDLQPWIIERAGDFRGFFGKRLETVGTRWETAGTRNEAPDTQNGPIGKHSEAVGTRWETVGTPSRTDSQTTDTELLSVPDSKRVPPEAVAISENIFGRLVAAGAPHAVRTSQKPEAYEGAIRNGADTVDKLHRIDGHSWDDVRTVVDWLFEVDDFWVPKGNFQTATKLRAKDKHGVPYFDTWLKQARNHGQASRTPTRRAKQVLPSAGLSGDLDRFVER